jgi:hypothetical protein
LIRGPSGLTAGWTCYRRGTALGHSLRRCGARQGWRRCTSGCRTVDGNQPWAIPEGAQKRGRVDVSIALSKPEIEPVGGCADRVALADPGTDNDAGRRQVAICRQARIALLDHHVSHACNDPTERDDPGSGRRDARTERRSVLQAAVAWAVQTGRRAKWVDDRRSDRWLVAVGHEHGQRKDSADHVRRSSAR